MSNLKIKINKVIPQEETRKSQNDPYKVNGVHYIPSPTRVDENYTGLPLYFLFTITLPSLSHDFEYLKVDIRVENMQFTKQVTRNQEVFKDIPKTQLQREVVLEFIPPFKGKYLISIETAYRAKYFVQSSQPPPEKRDHNKMQIKCDQPFKIEENIISEDKSGSITFPLFIQYSIESQLPYRQLNFQTSFESEKFKFKQLHDKESFNLKKNQVFYLMYEIEPKSVKEILKQKGISVGMLNLKYGVKGVVEKKTSLKTTDKYVFFRASAVTNEVPKKDIVEVKVVFSKIYNLNFNLGDLKLEIDEKQMPQVKILKTSVDKIHLDHQKEVSVIFSAICLKSGIAHLKGISLRSSDNLIIYFLNDLFLFVSTEPEHKASAILENTAEFMIEDSLI